MAFALLASEHGFTCTKNSYTPQGSWVEKTLVVALVELEIQVVFGVLVVVQDYEVPK